MSIQHVELSSALRPELQPEELLLFVQDSVGLYEGKDPLPQYQNGHVYLTSHRITYIDDDRPRESSIAINLKDVVRHEFYAGFLKSSPKLTIYLKQQQQQQQRQDSSSNESSTQVSSTLSRSYITSSRASTPVLATISTAASRSPATGNWICPICSFSNPIPTAFDPSLVDASTPRPPCSACGVKPPFPLLLKAAISAAATRYDDPSSKTRQDEESAHDPDTMLDMHEFLTNVPKAASRSKIFQKQSCRICTFENHPSMAACEMCGSVLQSRGPSQILLQRADNSRAGSPGGVGKANQDRTLSQSPESIKISFRGGGEKGFLTKLREALVQREWILKNAPAISPMQNASESLLHAGGATATTSGKPAHEQQNLGIASILARNEQRRLQTQTIIGDAFSDLEHLMASAKQVIDLAESFQRVKTSPQTNPDGSSSLNQALPQSSSLDPTTALTLLGSANDSLTRSSTASATAYLTSLSRTLSDFLTDDARGLLRREGGIMSLIDLWAVFNRARGGVELVSPKEVRDAVECFERLRLPVRLRRFKSGLVAVRGVEWSDERIVDRILEEIARARIAEAGRLELEGLREEWAEESGRFDEPQHTHEAASSSVQAEQVEPCDDLEAPAPRLDDEAAADRAKQLELLDLFGVGITAKELASRLGWSVGVAEEELVMAEDRGALCREEGIEGVRWWKNAFDPGPS